MENTLHRLSVWGQDSRKTGNGYSTVRKAKSKDTEINTDEEFSKNSTRLDSKDVWKV
jgi:hypothetical protein